MKSQMKVGAKAELSSSDDEDTSSEEEDETSSGEQTSSEEEETSSDEEDQRFKPVESDDSSSEDEDEDDEDEDAAGTGLNLSAHAARKRKGGRESDAKKKDGGDGAAIDLSSQDYEDTTDSRDVKASPSVLKSSTDFAPQKKGMALSFTNVVSFDDGSFDDSSVHQAIRQLLAMYRPSLTGCVWIQRRSTAVKEAEEAHQEEGAEGT